MPKELDICLCNVEFCVISIRNKKPECSDERSGFENLFMIFSFRISPLYVF